MTYTQSINDKFEDNRNAFIGKYQILKYLIDFDVFGIPLNSRFVDKDYTEFN